MVEGFLASIVHCLDLDRYQWAGCETFVGTCMFVSEEELKVWENCFPDIQLPPLCYFFICFIPGLMLPIVSIVIR